MDQFINLDPTTPCPYWTILLVPLKFLYNLNGLPDEVVRVPGEQSLTVSGPGQAGHLRRLGPGGAGDLRPQVLHQVLALQVPHLDAGAAGRTQPVPVGGEGEAVDGLAAVQGVQVLPVIEVPQHGLGVLPTAGTQGAVRRESHRVDVASVTD